MTIRNRTTYNRVIYLGEYLHKKSYNKPVKEINNCPHIIAFNEGIDKFNFRLLAFKTLVNEYNIPECNVNESSVFRILKRLDDTLVFMNNLLYGTKDQSHLENAVAKQK